MGVLLLGNGMNQLEKLTPKWGMLLERIAEEHNCPLSESLSNILSFELLENRILRQGKLTNEYQVHRKIAECLQQGDLQTRTDWTDTVHARLLRLPVDTILTTNYDYALERALDPKFRPRHNTTETIYSLRRWQQAGGKRVYHIHGECGYPRSICLGYEHYAGTLQRVREQIVRSTSKTGEGRSFQLADVLQGLTEKPADSWVFDFFLEDVFMLGLGLDVSEMDLWWLLSFRAKQLATGRLPVRNRIVFLDTGFDVVANEAPDCTNADCCYKSRAMDEKRQNRKRRKELLEAFGVEYRMCDGETFAEQYENAILFLQQSFRADGKASRKTS